MLELATQLAAAFTDQFRLRDESSFWTIYYKEILAWFEKYEHAGLRATTDLHSVHHGDRRIERNRFHGISAHIISTA